MRAEIRLVFIALSLGSLILAPALPGSHAASTYLPGVKTGNAAAYSVSASWGLPGPPTLPFINANFTRLTITDVTGTNITANQLTTYTNGTTLVDLIQGDVATDSGNITFWLISENLTTGDPIYTTPNAPIINETLLETFAGTPRTLDVYNATQIFPRVSLQTMNVFLSSGNETSVGVLVEAPNGTRTGNVLLSLFAGSGPYIGNSTTLTVIVAGSTPDIPPVANFFVQAPNSTTILRVGQPA